MISQRTGRYPRTKQPVPVTPMGADEQARRTQAAVAARAYEIFESRGSASWHELEDWREAESELVKPLSCGRMNVEDSLWVGTDVAVFQEGTINIWVAPRRLTICGEPRVQGKAISLTPTRSDRERNMIFRVTNLPFDIDPFGATANLKGRFLEIHLSKGREKPNPEAKTTAA